MDLAEAAEAITSARSTVIAAEVVVSVIKGRFQKIKMEIFNGICH